MTLRHTWSLKMHSEVNLIGLTNPTAFTGCETAGDLVAYTARVSNPANQNNTKTAPKLLKFLIREQHWSPFEMVHITMEIKTTRDIARQILRHRSFAFQEFSQRYAVASDFVSTREPRLQDPVNRQNSIYPSNAEVIPLTLAFERLQREVIDLCKKHYATALDLGIAKEQARALLPEGLTASTLYMAGSLRSWIHYIDLRCGNGTQKEHMIVAEQCKKIVLENFPMLEEYWANNEN
jgi:thymidylate synthase (FAD)